MAIMAGGHILATKKAATASDRDPGAGQSWNLGFGVGWALGARKPTPDPDPDTLPGAQGPITIWSVLFGYDL